MSKLTFRQENEERLKKLIELDKVFTKEQFDPEHQGIPKMPLYDGSEFELKPDSHAHPRVQVTKESIADILRYSEMPDAEDAVKAFEKLIETEENGILPEPFEQPKGLYSFDNYKLTILQAKALAYALSGNREYGYEALIGIRNYLLTMCIRWLKADICRHFGYAMYVAACIYDWCYDLMNDDCRYEIICGVGYNMCIGETEGILKAGATKRIDKVKMEIGFPPAKQNAVTGHGCELQLMRDYMTFAIAIYGEEPSWWNFVGKRFYTEYPPVRKIFYEAGTYPQGTNYAPYRLQADAWVCWIWKAALGFIPFVETDMRRVLPSLLSVEIDNRVRLRVGDDDAPGDLMPTSCGTCALIYSWLFNDACMKAWAKYFARGYSDFSEDSPLVFHWIPNDITPAEFLILNGNGVAPAADRREGMELLTYNGGFYGCVTVRDKWGEDAAMVMMKGLIRSTANHDHHDAGTFQIAYKGLISGDSGVYETYSSPQHFYYHQSTIAHNGVLVYNPAHGDTELIIGDEGIPVNRMRYYYSGGQRVVSESGGLTKWLSAEYDMAREIGRSFLLDESGKPVYAYYAVDNTKAYHEDTMVHSERHMLTVYTGDKAVPMVFFVYDDVEAADASFRKAFLLQCPTDPVVDQENRIIRVCQSRGQMVLHNIMGGTQIETYCGEGRQFFNPKDDPEKHGINIECIVEGAKSSIRGHAEIVEKGIDRRTKFLNVIYVTDAGSVDTTEVTSYEENGSKRVSVKTKAKTVTLILSEGPVMTANSTEGDTYLLDVKSGKLTRG